MNSLLIFPSMDRSAAFNVSGTFDLSDEEEVIEVMAFDLPAGHVVVFERGFQLASCDDMTWRIHKEPCCGIVSIHEDDSGLILSLPGKYRAVILRDNNTAPSAAAVEAVRLLVNRYTDESGALRLRHNCCARVDASVCDQIGSLGTNGRVGG